MKMSHQVISNEYRWFITKPPFSWEKIICYSNQMLKKPVSSINAYGNQNLNDPYWIKLMFYFAKLEDIESISYYDTILDLTCCVAIRKTKYYDGLAICSIPTRTYELCEYNRMFRICTAAAFRFDALKIDFVCFYFKKDINYDFFVKRLKKHFVNIYYEFKVDKDVKE